MKWIPHPNSIAGVTYITPIWQAAGRRCADVYTRLEILINWTTSLLGPAFISSRTILPFTTAQTSHSVVLLATAASIYRSCEDSLLLDSGLQCGWTGKVMNQSVFLSFFLSFSVTCWVLVTLLLRTSVCPTFQPCVTVNISIFHYQTERKDTMGDSD